jgi:hypothetical protein
MADNSIKEAQEIFAKAKADQSRDIRFALVEKAVTEGSGDVFPNHSYYDALVLSWAMISHAQNSFFMLIGDGVENFVGQMEQEFREMLMRFNKNGGEAKIAIVSSASRHSPLFDKFSSEFKNVFSYGFLRPKPGRESAIRHFTVADGKMYRYEESHAPIIDDNLPGSADVIKAEVSFDNEYFVERLKNQFDDYWKYHQKPVQ